MNNFSRPNLFNDDLTDVARAAGVLREPDPLAGWRRRVDDLIEDAGQRLANETEAWLRGGAR